jgi:hypothetical protein
MSFTIQLTLVTSRYSSGAPASAGETLERAMKMPASPFTMDLQEM